MKEEIRNYDHAKVQNNINKDAGFGQISKCCAVTCALVMCDK